jgi:hypothetical protein
MGKQGHIRVALELFFGEPMLRFGTMLWPWILFRGVVFG